MNQAAEAGLGAGSTHGEYGEQLDGSARQAEQSRQIAALFGAGSSRLQVGPAPVLQARLIKPFWFAGSEELGALLAGHASTETLERSELEKAWKLAQQIPAKQAVATHLGAALQQGEYKGGADALGTTPRSAEPTPKREAPVKQAPVTTPLTKDIEHAPRVAKDSPQPSKLELPSAKESVPLSPTDMPRGPTSLANEKGEAAPAKGGSSSTGPSLRSVLADVYRDKGGKPSADDIVGAVKTHIGTGNAETVLNDPAFSWQLMEAVGAESGRRLHEQITKVTKPASALRLKVANVYPMRWTLCSTNNVDVAVTTLLTRYAQRMLIEDKISEAIQFFHIDSLSSMVGLKVDFDLQLTLMASSLYRMLANKIGREYARAQPKTLFQQPAGPRRRSDHRPAQHHGAPGQAGPRPLPGRIRHSRQAHDRALARRPPADHPDRVTRAPGWALAQLGSVKSRLAATTPASPTPTSAATVLPRRLDPWRLNR